MGQREGVRGTRKGLPTEGPEKGPPRQDLQSIA